MRELMARIRSGSMLLWYSGIVSVILTAIFLIMALVDPTMITGVRRWVKPAKFCISFVFYFWTLAWMLPVLVRSASRRRGIALSSVVIMVIELAAIVLQATRGVASHFNNSSVFNGAVYAVMGIAIATNTIILLLLALFASFAWKPLTGAHSPVASHVTPNNALLPLSHAAERTGISCGLWLIVAGSVFGILISIHGAHAIGVTEDAAGMPLLGWKRTGGDLRVAHFLGLHGFQAAPFVAALTRNSAVVYAVSVAWVLVSIFLYRSALAGTSIWPM